MAVARPLLKYGRLKSISKPIWQGYGQEFCGTFFDSWCFLLILILILLILSCIDTANSAAGRGAR